MQNASVFHAEHSYAIYQANQTLSDDNYREGMTILDEFI